MSSALRPENNDSLPAIMLRYGAIVLVLVLLLLLLVVSDVSSQEGAENGAAPAAAAATPGRNDSDTARQRAAELTAIMEQRFAGQREIWQQAQAALDDADMEAFHALRQHLADYPLNAYLDYRELHARLHNLPQAEVLRFLDTHAGSPLAERLQRDWVGELVAQERWQQAVAAFDINNSHVALSCQVLAAQLRLGDDSALQHVPALWAVGRSQPTACDPLFNDWLQAGGLSDEIAWQRFSRSMSAGQTGLARYVAGLMSGQSQRLANAWLQIDERPERLRQHESLQLPGARSREIIRHGVRRLAGIDAPQAMLVLQEYHQYHVFTESWLTTEQQFVALRLLLQGFVSETETLLRSSPELVSETLVGWILRDALREHDWHRLGFWLDRLPEGAAQSERWLYWRARMLAQNGATQQAQPLYQQVASTRSYYGFLAADRLGLAPAIIDEPVAVDVADVAAFYDMPGILRAHELFRLGDDINARNEWQAATGGLGSAQVMASGVLADSWGWHRNSIQAMIQVSHWDDLALRFPLAYAELFAEAAREHQVAPQFLKAVSRQESAFMHDVQSPAGARGLMQLMPGTARETAAALGLQVSPADLYQPDLNIELGTRYMAELLETFDGNRILAAAAYNAGPNRARQWLARSRDNPMPADMWVETIPFLETRGYVQNVLAYTVIFGERMADPVPVLTAAEAAARF